jgi:hypothetical protein
MKIYWSTQYKVYCWMARANPGKIKQAKEKTLVEDILSGV